MKRIVLAFVALLIATSLFSRTDFPEEIEKQFALRGEIYFKTVAGSPFEVSTLTRIISISNVKDGEVFAYANRDEFTLFLELGIPYTLLQHPGTLLSEKELNMGGDHQKGAKTVWNFYPTYPQYVDFMVGFASDHPDICRLDTIGTSINGRLLLAVKISDSVNLDQGEPRFFYTSSIHGDELTGYILMMHLIDSLLTGYNVVPRITDLVNNHEIYINPLANPDGTYKGGNSTVNGAVRYNANWKDLNRNFPDPKGGPNPTGAWEKETKAFMAYDTAHSFTLSMNFHGGAEVFNYPWDTWVKHHADDAWMQFAGREWADTVHHYSYPGYMTFMNNGITNGNFWYEIEGGRQDYTTYFHYGREITLEISDTMLMPANKHLTYWKYNRNALLNFIEESGYGINGQITDSVTGEPLDAKVSITGHDIDHSEVYSTLPSGWYYRLIAEGTYDLTFSRAGYFSKTISASSSKWNTTRLNVKLVPTNIGLTPTLNKARLTISPNPCNGAFMVHFPANTGEFHLIVTDGLGKNVYNSVVNGANGNAAIDLGQSPAGIYLVRLMRNNSVWEQKLMVR